MAKDDGTKINFQVNQDQEKALLLFASKAQQLLLNQFSIRTHLEQVDRDYMRENNWTRNDLRARIANKNGDAHKMRDITIPIVMPQVESALAYMANVFLTGYPLFGTVSSPDLEDAALQMETIIAENAITAGWARQLMMFFRDGLKYNLHAVEVDWEQKTTWTVENDITAPNGARAKNTLWAGNVFRRMDLYNTFFDPRVHPADIHSEGEYAGYIKIASRTLMKKYLNDLFGQIPVETVIRAFESSPAFGSATSSTAPFGYYVPIINPFPLMDRQNLDSFNWLNWALNSTDFTQKSPGIRYNNIYQITKMYARIIPEDFDMKVPQRNTPQVWKMVIVNGSVLVHFERLPNIHSYIPIIFGQPIEDGLDFQTKSFAQNVTDMQDVGTAMLSGYMASKRRLVGDRTVYDPSRISSKDINSRNPAAKIPVRPSAYGKPITEAFAVMPYRDEQTHSLLEGAQIVDGYANKINGQNPAQQGQFVKGNKTLHEYQDTMGHGNDRNQMMAMETEGQVFTVAKEIIKLNILQFQKDTTLFNRDKNQQVPVDSTSLRKAAIHFKVSDGLLPSDKLMSADEYQTIIQTLGSSPQLGSGYNLSPMFSYMVKIQSGIDLSPFEKSQLQMQFEQMQQQWQQVAESAIKAGQAPPPQPQMPPELIQQLQQAQQSGGVTPSPTGPALESTQGGN